MTLLFGLALGLSDRITFRKLSSPKTGQGAVTLKRKSALIIRMISGEVKNPRRIMPKAMNSTIYRIIFFYMTGALCVGIVSASNDASLLGAIAAGAPGAAKSPYIICTCLSRQ